MRFALSAKVWTNTYICWIGFDTLKSSKSPERDSNPGPRDYDRVQRADHAATLPPYYIYIYYLVQIMRNWHLLRSNMQFFLGILFI